MKILIKYTRTNILKCNLNNKGYDPFIDYLKGISIILIILTHCITSTNKSQIFFPIWGSPAVPVFLIIQVFHYYKKGEEFIMPNFYKVWKRIVRPFIIVELIILLLFLYNEFISFQKMPAFKEIAYTLTGGPGTYYPWIYLQFSILLPLLSPLFKYKRKYTLIIFIILSQLFEYLCCIFYMQEWIYRITFFRYIFLIYLGYILAKKGYSLNMVTLIISIISIYSVLLFAYTDINFFPAYYNVEAWGSCHWICYIYIAFLIITISKYIYSFVKENKIIKTIENIGKYSYETYLFQLLYFTCISEYVNVILQLESRPFINIAISLLLCITPVLTYKRIKNKYS